jgi:anti-sigma B factor antagonist
VEITSEKVGGVTLATVHGENLDASNIQDFKRDISPLVESNGKLAIDLHQVQFIDSAGCGAILSCFRQVNAVGGQLRLCAVSKPVKALFELVRLHRILDICTTRDEAVQSFQA